MQAPGSIATTFQPGTSGNPTGRPAGTRNKFSAQFVADVATDWEANGAAVLERVRRLSPERYLEVCARLVPKEFAVTLQDGRPELTADHWAVAMPLFNAVLAAIPKDKLHDPAWVQSFVTNALRAASAKQIEPDNVSAVTSEATENK